MKEHGICVAGTSLEHAFNVADLVEQTAFQAWLQVSIAKDKAIYAAMDR